MEDTDRRPTGPPQPAAADARAQRSLDARVVRLLGDPRTATARWAPLAHSIDPRIPADPYWPILADRLRVAERAGINVTALVRAAAGRPLPDEQPAAALWWRLAGHLSPATTVSDGYAIQTLRPDWTLALTVLLGTRAADRVLADPAWPTLVAAVGHAESTGWPPEQLLATAHDLLCAGHPDDEPPRPEELTTALAWRVGLLTDRASAAGTGTPLPASPHLDQLPDPHPALDEDWWAGLVEPDDTEPEAAEPHLPEAPDTDPGRASDAGRHTGQPEPVEPAEPADASHVDRDRLLELNRQAAEFFAAHYRDAWAPGYLAERLGTDLPDDERLVLGYAPAGWTALTDHLRRGGATDTEIVAAGLGSYAYTGRVIDRFRDRLVFAIRDGQGAGEEIRGWIGRRNPAHDQNESSYPVPKYLNTAETDLFTKGRELYGLTEGAGALAAGATPVLVEGPVDALAVNLAGDGDYVGIAPLGTAFTDAQADRLRPYLRAGGPGVVVATDADHAGQLAAERMFWRLTVRGGDPRHLVVPSGKDPAELLQTAGPAALRQALAASTSLASALVDARIAAYADRLNTVEGSVHATRRAAEVIAALPSTSWPAHLTHLVARTGIDPGTAMSEVLDAAPARTEESGGRQPTGPDGSGPDPAIGARGKRHSTGTPAAAIRPAPVQRPGRLAESVQAAQRAAAANRHPARSARPGPGHRR